MTAPIPLNREIANVFRKKADRLYAKAGGSYFFRARAYEQAADAIDILDESLADMYQRSWIVGIQKVEGVGNRIAHDIERELMKQGIQRKGKAKGKRK